MSDLDISFWFKEAASSSPVDHDWMDENSGVLPMQNLDIVPDLEAIWDNSDSSLKFVQNTGDAPRTMLDLTTHKSDVISQDLVKRTRLAMIQSPRDLGRIKSTLDSSFSRDTLLANRTALGTVIAERGLLGPYYIDANDFSDCASGSGSKGARFAQKYAKDAAYLLPKTACGGCIHNAGSRCSVFQKEITLEVPYTEDIALALEGQAEALGRKVASASSLTPKERIRLALLAEAAPGPVKGFTGVPQQAPKEVSFKEASEQLIAATSLVRKNRDAQQKALETAIAQPVVRKFAREFLKGRTAEQAVATVKESFNGIEINQAKEGMREIFKEAGLLGSLYTRQDIFDDCREGAALLAKHGSTVQSVLASSRCAKCTFSQAGSCSIYNRPLIASVADAVTPSAVERLRSEHVARGALTKTAGVITADLRESAKLIHRIAITRDPLAVRSAPREYATTVQANMSSGGTYREDPLTTRSIIASTKTALNNGLYGEELMQHLGSMFDSRALVAAQQHLTPILAEQGLQGHYYLDPTLYTDYGYGCRTASSKFRKTNIPFVKQGSKCGGCLHKAGNRCSQFNKELVAEPTYFDRTAQQKAVLESRNEMFVSPTLGKSSGANDLVQFSIGASSLDISLNPEFDSLGDIEITENRYKAK